MAFGTAPWSKQQKSRVDVFRVTGARPEALAVYRRATCLLPPRLVRGNPDRRTGEVQTWWDLPQTPDLVAKNVVAGGPWWSGFGHLWEQVRQATRAEHRQWALYNEGEGLHQMISDSPTMPDGPEAHLVRACQEAWRRRLGALGERARSQGLDFTSLARMESPSCQRSQRRRFSSGGSTSGSGRVARIAVSSAWSQGWSTALGALLTLLTRTSPLAG